MTQIEIENEELRKRIQNLENRETALTAGIANLTADKTMLEHKLIAQRKAKSHYYDQLSARESERLRNEVSLEQLTVKLGTALKLLGIETLYLRNAQEAVDKLYQEVDKATTRGASTPLNILKAFKENGYVGPRTGTKDRDDFISGGTVNYLVELGDLLGRKGPERAPKALVKELIGFMRKQKEVWREIEEDRDEAVVTLELIARDHELKLKYDPKLMTLSSLVTEVRTGVLNAHGVMKQELENAETQAMNLARMFKVEAQAKSPADGLDNYLLRLYKAVQERTDLRLPLTGKITAKLKGSKRRGRKARR